jgi:adenylylsulfate kinase
VTTKVYWITGLPSSGKSTMAMKLFNVISDERTPCVILDGDDFRKYVSSDCDFSVQGRRENLRRAAGVASMLRGQGFNVICCFVSPERKMRRYIKMIIGEPNFVEIYLRVDAELCRMTDVKGNWMKADLGFLKDFTGKDAEYEQPLPGEAKYVFTRTEDLDKFVARVATETCQKS